MLSGSRNTSIRDLSRKVDPFDPSLVNPDPRQKLRRTQPPRTLVPTVLLGVLMRDLDKHRWWEELL